jgi:hypothetical protein
MPLMEFDMFSNLTDIELILAGLILIILFFLGYKIGSIIATRKGEKAREALESESYSTSKSLKKLFEDEKNQVISENTKLKETNTLLTDKVEEYRKKLAGLGLLNFSGNKKRADILYSLLLENEALEQLLAEQGEKLADERKDHLMHRMKDIRKRQRLMAEIFNDDTIKSYVRDVLSDEGRIEEAARRIENEEDGRPLLSEGESFSTEPEEARKRSLTET